MSNYFNSKLFKQLSLVILLCGMFASLNAQTTPTTKLKISKKATNASPDFEFPIGSVSINFVIEDDIMQSGDGSGVPSNTDGIRRKNNANHSDNSSKTNTSTATTSALALSDKVKIFPNPAHSFTNINLGTVQINSFEIVSSLGQIVQTSQVTLQYQRLDTSNLKAGLYYIRIYTIDQQVISKPIIIQ